MPHDPADPYQILLGDVRETLASLLDQSVQCCVTSPPYWGLRDYGSAGQIGLEPTPDEYVAQMVAVFREVKRVLRDDGTLWLNLGDSYASQGGPEPAQTKWQVKGASDGQNGGLSRRVTFGLKPKGLVGIPWRVAFALQADGWYLRSDIIWAKPNAMPESVTDRPTKAHEYIFLLTKQAQYYYDAKAIKEPYAAASIPRLDRANSGYGPPGQTPHRGVAGPRKRRTDKQHGHGRRHAGFNDRDTMPKDVQQMGGRNKRTVWTVPTQPYPDAHFATFPEALITPCVLAGSRVGDTVLDPFAGSGTTGAVAVRHQRAFIGCELNPAYVALAHKRITKSLAK